MDRRDFGRTKGAKEMSEGEKMVWAAAFVANLKECGIHRAGIIARDIVKELQSFHLSEPITDSNLSSGG